LRLRVRSEVSTALRLRASVHAGALRIHLGLTAGADILTGVHSGAASFLSLRRGGAYSDGSHQRYGCSCQDCSF
jgi:hypothetical protein